MSRAKRAKQSKMPKKMLITLALVTGVTGTLAVYGTKINKTNIGTLASKVSTYETNEFVKDIFTTEDGTRYLPIVYGDAFDQITKSELENKFRAAGMEIESISSGTIGTGTKIKTKNATYTVLIYGDVDGNGSVNIRDVNQIIRTLLYDEEPELTGIKALAANVQDVPEKAIDIRDVHRIVEFLLERSTIIDPKDVPESDIKRDKEAPKIEIIGDNPLLVRLNKEYVDPGIKVTDNLDPNVKWTASPKTIDTSKPGKYNVIYTATDASGNTSTAVRVVEVEDELAPVITLNDPREEIAINVFDKAAFEALDLGATAKDEKESNIKVNIEGIDKVNVDIPGTYTIKYTATNSQGNSATPVERKIKVINYVTDIALKGTIVTTQYKEGEDIDLEGVTVDITRAYGDPETVSLVDLKAETNEEKDYFEIELKPFEAGKATYNEANDAANANIELTAKCIFNNPADGTKTESNTRRIGYVTVIGQIRELIKVTDSNFKEQTSGIIYDPINVVKVTTKRYQEELNEENLEVKITSRDGDTSTAHKQINFTDSGAEIRIWAAEPGKYTLTISAGKAEPIVRDITITESNTVDGITLGTNGKPFEGILKAGGTYKDIELSFAHNYGTSETEEISRLVDVTANRITFTKDNDIEKYAFLGIKDGNLVELSPTDKTTPVTAVRIWAKSGVVPAGQEKVIKVLGIEVDKGTADATTQETINVNIYPDSKYTVSLAQDNLKLYLQDEGEDNTFMDTDGTIYTLIEIQKVDQYESRNDPTYIPAKANEISNLEATINSGNIVFVDSACKYDAQYAGNPFIKVAGFNDKVSGGYTKVSSGNIKYVGIALENVYNGTTGELIGDEDIRLEERSEIYVYHGNSTSPVITLDISEIVKKNITSLRAENLIQNEYCYEKPTIMTLKSGHKQKPLEAGKITYEVYKNGSTSKDNTVMIREASANNGAIDVEFQAPNAGKYKIKAILTQNGRTITLTTDEITIEENPIVTSVAFRTKETTEEPSTNFGQVKINKTVRKEIVYMHDYTDKNGNAIVDDYGVQISRPIEKANIPIYEYITLPNTNPNYIEINLYNVDYNLSKETEWANAPVDGLSIEVGAGAPVGTTTQFTMLIDNSKYAEYGGQKDTPVTATVSIGAMSEIEGVILKPLNANGSMNLYKKTDPAAGTNNKVTTYGGDKYTLFEMAYIDADGDEVEILDASKVRVGLKGTASSDTILLADDAYIDTPDFGENIEIMAFAKDGEGYRQVPSGSFDYIGISVLDTNITSITIYYPEKGYEETIPIVMDGVASKKASKVKAIKASLQPTETEGIKTNNSNTKNEQDTNKNENTIKDTNTNVVNNTVENTTSNEVTNNITNTTSNTIANEVNVNNSTTTSNTSVPTNNTVEQVNTSEPKIPAKQDEEE